MTGNTASPGKSSPSSKSKPKNNTKMTRAVVANLNRQKAEKEGTQSSSDGILESIHSTPRPSTASPSTTPRKATPQKSLPPQPSPASKELPDIPEFYIVRPAPSSSVAKIERNDRRVFINRNTMEKVNIYQGSVVLVQRHDPARWVPVLAARGENEVSLEDDESQYPTDDGEEDSGSQMTVGVAWPLDRIEPNGTLHY